MKTVTNLRLLFLLLCISSTLTVKADLSGYVISVSGSDVTIYRDEDPGSSAHVLYNVDFNGYTAGQITGETIIYTESSPASIVCIATVTSITGTYNNNINIGSCNVLKINANATVNGTVTATESVVYLFDSAVITGVVSLSGSSYYAFDDSEVQNRLEFLDDGKRMFLQNCTVTDRINAEDNGVVRLENVTVGDRLVVYDNDYVDIYDTEVGSDMRIVNNTIIVLDNIDVTGDMYTNSNNSSLTASDITAGGFWVMSTNDANITLSDISASGTLTAVANTANITGDTISIGGDVTIKKCVDGTIDLDRVTVGNATPPYTTTTTVTLNSSDIDIQNSTFYGPVVASKDTNVVLFAYNTISDDISSTSDGEVTIQNNTVSGDLTITTPTVSCTESGNTVSGTNSGCPVPKGFSAADQVANDPAWIKVEQPASLVTYDLTGRVMQTQAISAGVYPSAFALDRLPAGIYLQQVVVNGVVTSNHKVIVTR